MSRDQKNIGANLFKYWKSAIWMLIMCVVFLMPADNLSKAPSLSILAETIHIISFAILTWVLYYDMPSSSVSKISFRKTGLIIFATGLFFGILIEALQEFSGLGRHAEIKDVLYDMGGIIISLGILFLLFQRKLKKDLTD